MGENYKLVSQLIRGSRNTQEAGSSGGVAMFDAVLSALVSAVVDEVCVDVPEQEVGKKNALAASKPPDSTTKVDLDADNLRAVGRQALLPAPSMWN
jgi:hypothetical protein